MKKQNPIDKKGLLRKQDHLTRPPLLEGKVKNKGLNPKRKPAANKKKR
ncbi:MAG TPA: hypothetical protein VIY48_00315 [Candidatus Paceibacterota bacterium]